MHVGRTAGGFASANPPSEGARTGARSVFWNVRSYGGSHALPRGGKDGTDACSYGPDLTFVGVRFEQRGDSPPCRDWAYQPGGVMPENLFWAQRVRRRSRGTAAVAQARRRRG